MSDEHKLQADRILAVLESHEGQWVSVFDLLNASRSLSLTRRITDLRRRLEPKGIFIRNELRKPGRRSFYMLERVQGQLRLIA